MSLAVSLVSGGQGSGDRRPIVPGEVLVKFAAASTGGKLLAAADPESIGTDAALARYLATASQEVGIPLRAERLTSGGELLLAIDEEALVSQVLERVRGDSRVETAEERKVVRESPFEAPQREVLVRFPADSAGIEDPFGNR